MNSSPKRYTLANSQPTSHVIKVSKFFFLLLHFSFLSIFFFLLFNKLKKQQISSDNLELNKTNSSSQNTAFLFKKFPLFASPISELVSYNDNHVLYDNVLNYCRNSSNEENSIYAKFDFRHRYLSLPYHDKQFEQRCANYDNLSYLIIDRVSSRKLANRGIRNIASCKDYFAATNRFISNENEQRE